ncbi:MAG: hypothetical protein Q8N92_10815 [Erysipelotrichaceae bacterium]|nr:hypothetical protein [Erysipelotrichaceae bacterium]
MEKIKDSVKQYALNEDYLLDKIIKRNKNERRHFMFKRLSIGLAFATVLGLLVVTTLLGGAPKDTIVDNNDQRTTLAYAMVAVDINPSFEVYTDEEGVVIEIKSLNDDAKLLDVSVFVGLPAEEAVEGLIALAIEAGFINSEDEDDDFVLVTTVLFDEEDEDGEQNMDSLGYKIQTRLAESELIGDNVQVSIIKATLREKFEAEGKEVPLGLYIINGMIEVEGEWVSISEFVKDAKNIDELNDRAENVVRGPINRGSDDDEEVEDEEVENGESRKPEVLPIPSNPGRGSGEDDEEEGDE